jgi:uncharacterized protein YeaO (DUF488 family)
MRPGLYRAGVYRTGAGIVQIRIKRIYEAAEAADGCRILVDRLWPRGISKDRAKLDYWAKEVSPSNELRQWYQHDAARWDEFKRRYFKEIRSKPETGELLQHCTDNEIVTFLFSSKEMMLNNAVALKEYVEHELLKEE